MSTSFPILDMKTRLEHIQQAMNHQDVEAFLLCFQETYASEQPAHPGREFCGHDMVRKNWEAIFSGVPDFRAELIRYAPVDDIVWTEWHWSGTRTDGSPFEMRGVIVWGVEEGRIAWGRLYMENVEQDKIGIAGMINAMTSSS